MQAPSIRPAHLGSSRSGRWLVAATATSTVVLSLVPAAGMAQSTAPKAGPPTTGASTAAPASRSMGAPGRPQPTASRVQLVTGDDVVLRHLASGRTAASLTPSSPSFGHRVRTLITPSATYLIPQLSRSEMRRLDLSLFNITALAAVRNQGRLPLVVRFDSRSSMQRTTGLQVAAGTARTTASGVTVARASYRPGTGGIVAAFGSQWRHVRSVRLADPHAGPTHTSAGYQLRTLTFNLTNTKGQPVRFGIALVQNLDNAGLFDYPMFVVNGKVKVSVPEGHYSITSGPFFGWWLAIAPEFTVSQDTTVSLSGQDATTRPKETVPRRHPIETDFSYIRTSAHGGGSSASFAGQRAPRVTPVPAQLSYGNASSSVGATLVPNKSGRATQQGHLQVPGSVALTKDAAPGVPRQMSFTHNRGDFAKLTHHYYANGAKRIGWAWLYGFTRGDFFAFISGIPSHLPGKRAVWLQASSHITWLQGLAGIATWRNYLEMDAPMHRYRSPGRVKAPLAFFRGPDGPGRERAVNGGVSWNCQLCRHGKWLVGDMPLMSAAGTKMTSYSFDRRSGGWSLSEGKHLIARGKYGVYPFERLPDATHRYTLTATSSPSARVWRLSTNVTDTWKFASGFSHRVVPLLMPSYVPPATLNGVIPTGRVHYRLHFDNLGPIASRITNARVDYSVNNGHLWKPATLTRLDARTFRVSYVNPAPRPDHRLVSLRVRGVDAGGRRVEEIAKQVYRIGRVGHAGTPAHTHPVARDPGHARGARAACDTASAYAYRCFALVEAAGRQALNAALNPRGWGANDLRDAYGLPRRATTPGQKVAVVVAYDYPSAERDLNRYRKQYGLPPCTTGNGCFSKINQNGVPGNYPHRSQGWALEAALDLQMISAACPTCQIVLAEANRPSGRSLGRATDAAVAAGAVVTNHSYGGAEITGIKRQNAPYNRPGVTAVAASGDWGFGPATFPASSPDVVAVGGTVLSRANNPRGWREVAWFFGGSGCSAYFAKPSYQTDTACTMRTFSDTSAVADDVAVYDSFGLFGHRGWFVVGGTSVSSPFVSGLIGAAQAGGIRPGSLYTDPSRFHDITRGSNGFCKGNYICTAVPGYDGPTGLGTPRGLTPFATTP